MRIEVRLSCQRRAEGVGAKVTNALDRLALPWRVARQHNQPTEIDPIKAMKLSSTASALRPRKDAASSGRRFEHSGGRGEALAGACARSKCRSKARATTENGWGRRCRETSVSARSWGH